MESIHLKGSADAIAELTRELHVQFGDQVQVSEPSAPIPGLMDREPLRKVELVEVVVNIGMSVAARAVYDLLKAFVERVRSEKRIEIVKDPPVAAPKEGAQESDPET